MSKQRTLFRLGSRLKISCYEATINLGTVKGILTWGSGVTSGEFRLVLSLFAAREVEFIVYNILCHMTPVRSVATIFCAFSRLFSTLVSEVFIIISVCCLPRFCPLASVAFTCSFLSQRPEAAHSYSWASKCVYWIYFVWYLTTFSQQRSRSNGRSAWTGTFSRATWPSIADYARFRDRYL